MRALGDKIGSTIIAQSAGVPTIAWNGDGITVRVSGFAVTLNYQYVYMSVCLCRAILFQSGRVSVGRRLC